MLPDVVDDFASRHPSCRDLEPLFFSCYAFGSKLAGGLAAGTSTLMLQSVRVLSALTWSPSVPHPPLSSSSSSSLCRLVGYRSGACSHDDRVRTVLIVLFSPVAIVLLLVGMAIFRSYPIDERRPSQLREGRRTSR